MDLTKAWDQYFCISEEGLSLLDEDNMHRRALEGMLLPSDRHAILHAILHAIGLED